MNNIKNQDEKIFNAIESELNRQRTTIELIASENFASEAVLEAAGSVLTNKYAEGYPGKRYYGGCESVDIAENIARDRLKKLFSADYANVQPHSGSQANMGVFNVFLNHMDTVMGLDLAHGGHLTHGSKVNFSGNMYNFISYGVSKKDGRVDFDDVWKKAKKYKPKLIICGGSAYPRFIEFSKFKEIADSIGAYLMGDVAHPSGLIAAKIHPSPWPYCDVITSTTHKTLRGPRGGMILLGKDFENRWGKIAPKSGRIKRVSELLDSSIMPGIQGGPLMHIIAAKAIAFKEALGQDFINYSHQVVKNAKTLAEQMIKKGYKLVSNGTDTHLILIDLSAKLISGKIAEQVLEKAGITVNKNMVPFDQKSPMVTSGIRIGTPAITTRGMKENEILIISELIDSAITNYDNDKVINEIKIKVKELCAKFPLYE
jgi:glycine hydroxymethyltransferase